MATKYTPFQKEILNKIEELNHRTNNLEHLFKENRNENMNRFDQVMGELETMRQENSIGVYQTRELREDVDGHEKRLKHLESRQ